MSPASSAMSVDLPEPDGPDERDHLARRDGQVHPASATTSPTSAR
jgi:hypothetical protein